MDYSKLTDEAFKMYNSFIYSGFVTEHAFELTKFCIKEFSMFKNLIIDESGNYVNY